MSREDAKVTRYDRSMAEAFERFCSAAWPGSARDTAPQGAQGDASDSAQPEARPDAPVFVFVKGRDIVGHVATLPVRLECASGTAAAHWIVGFMVLPEHRNGLVGPLLIKEVNRNLDCALSLFVEAPVLRILTGLKWSHLGVVPQYLRVLTPLSVSRHLQRGGLTSLGPGAGTKAAGAIASVAEPAARLLAGLALALVQAAWLGVSRLRGPATAAGEIREEFAFDASYDDLWGSVGGRFGACLARDRRYLQARFGGEASGYRLLACRQGERLAGYCVVRIRQFAGDPRMGDMKLGTIVDCLFDPLEPSAMHALLAAAVGLCKRARVDAVLCTASHSLLKRLLRANGFLPIPGNLNFALHNRTALPLQDVPLDAWHLMRGDSDADQNF